jgi:hypothetical protein
LRDDKKNTVYDFFVSRKVVKWKKNARDEGKKMIHNYLPWLFLGLSVVVVVVDVVAVVVPKGQKPW